MYRELCGALDEVGEVGVFELDEVFLHEPLGDLDVVLSENVPDTSTA